MIRKVPTYKFILKTSSIAKNPIPFQKKTFETYGDTFSISAGLKTKVILSRDAELAKHILQKNHKNYNKSIIQTQYLSKYIGYGLLTSNGAYWLQQRRLIQPAFHKEKLQKLTKIIDTAIDEQVRKIPEKQNADVYSLMNILAFEVVAKSLFNYSANKETLQRLQFIIEALQKFSVKEVRLPYKRWWYFLSGKTKYHENLVTESREIINTIIEQRRQSQQSHDDLLDMLLNAKYDDGTSMTNEQLIDEILILFVAGHETTANALTFTLFLLANHKDALAKVSEEIKNVSHEKSLLSKIEKLQYIKQCIEESMRLYPPAWITDRVAVENDNFKNNFIEKGTILGVSFYGIHRNPKYWDHAEVFLPERFSDENRNNTQPYYFPFGAGPRLCIGNGFAMYEMILAIEKIVSEFHIEAENDIIKVNPLVTLKPIGLRLNFTHRP